ncbi:MAG: lysozyme inhibitor LprI family protein [Sarcina sp.]
MKKISVLVLTLSVLITGVSVVGVTYKKSKDKVATNIASNEILEEKPEDKSTENLIDNTEEKTQKPLEQENIITKLPNKIEDKDSEKPTQKPVDKIPEKPLDKLAGTKNKYIDRLKACEDKEKNIHALAEVEDGYSNPGMKLTASKVLTIWDDELNIMYQDLKSKISPDDFKKLQSEQIQWIKDRDAKSITAGKQFEGGTMEGLSIISSKASTTRDRCYEIVNEYMK